MPWSAPVDPCLMRFVAQPAQFITAVPLQNQTILSPVNPTHAAPLVVEPPDETYNWTFASQRKNCHSLKRRNSSSDEDDEDLDQPPPKVHAGADKVAAKLSHLDIDPEKQRLVVEELSDDSQDDLEEDMSEADKPVVHLSDEVKTALAVGKSDSMSQLLQTELEKNKKALVIWRPPMNPLQTVVEDDDDLYSGIKIEEIFDDDDRMEVS